MSCAITIPNPLPSELVAISAEARAQIAAVEAQAACLTVVDTLDGYKAADEVVGVTVRLIKALEQERQRIKAPIIELGRALDDAASEAACGLQMVKGRLGGLLLAFQQTENRRRDEERQRLAENARAAEAENARRAEANRQEMARVAALQAATTEDAAPWEIDPVKVELLPVVELPGHFDQQLAAAPLKSAAVVAKTIKRVEITDPAMVPREFGGVALWIIDAKAVERLAKAGAQIPGVSVSEVQITASKG